MARDLKLQVLLNAVDNATAPLKKISRGSEKTAQALKASRDELRELQQQQKDVRGYRKAQVAMRGNERALRDAIAKQKKYTDSLESQRKAHVNIKASLTTARREYDKLAKHVLDAKQPNEQLSAALEKSRIRLASQQQSFDHSSRAIKQYRNRSRNAEDQVKQLNSAQGKQQERLQGLKRRLDTAGIGTDNLSRKARDLRGNEERLNSTLEEQQAKLRSVTAHQKRLAAARERYQRAAGNSRQISGAGLGAAASGGAALYTGARLIAPGVEYGAQMSAVQAVGRFEDEDPRLAALKAQSRELGATTAFSATEVGAGQEFLLRAGVSAEAISASMQDVLALAVANNTELGRTADIASNIAGTFKIDLEQNGAMTRVADVLSATASRANVDLEKLGETVKYLGGAEDLDLTLEQATAMAGMLGNVGIQGSQAGTTLRAMMNRLTAPTAKAAGIIEQLGLQVSNAQGNMRAMPDILRDINAATESLGSVERKEALQQIFGAEAGSGMAELVSQISTGALDELIDKLEQANGENAKMAAVRHDNLAGDLKALSSAWQEVGITMADTNDGPLRSLIQNITAITRGVGNWMKANPKLAGTLATAAGALAAIVAVGGTLLVLLGSILGPIAAVRYALTLLSLNPVSLTIMAIVAAVAALAGAAYLIYKHWEPLNAFMARLWGGIKAGLSKAWNGLKTVFRWSPIGLIKNNWSTIKSAIAAPVTAAKAKLTAAWTEIKAAFSGGLGEVAALLLNWSPFGLLWRGISAALERLGVDIPEKFSGMGGWIIDGIKAGITGKLGELKASITGVADSASGWFKDKLGINSPSRVFARFGGYTVDGLNQGLDAQRDEPARRVRDIAKRVATAGAGMAIGTAAVASPTAPGIEPPAQLHIDRRPAMSAAPAESGSGGLTITGGINIEVNAAPGMDEQALARLVNAEVQRALATASRDAAARRRSAFQDID